MRMRGSTYANESHAENSRNCIFNCYFLALTSVNTGQMAKDWQ